MTWSERWGRTRAGMAPVLPERFIDHYIVGVLYFASWASAVPVAVFVVVAVSWVLYVWRDRRRGETMPRSVEKQRVARGADYGSILALRCGSPIATLLNVCGGGGRVCARYRQVRRRVCEPCRRTGRRA